MNELTFEARVRQVCLVEPGVGKIGPPKVNSEQIRARAVHGARSPALQARVVAGEGERYRPSLEGRATVLLLVLRRGA